jgi:predicted kinase
MLAVFAGLPGTGKTTLACALAEHLTPALLLDKDQVRHALFGAQRTLYTRAQDDFCLEKMLDTAAWQLRHDPRTTVLLDGRTFTRLYQVRRLRSFASLLGCPLLLVECVCEPQVAAQRLSRDRALGEHPAGNRTPELYRELRADAELIPAPKLRLDTQRPVRQNIDRILSHLADYPQ